MNNSSSVNNRTDANLCQKCTKIHLAAREERGREGSGNESPKVKLIRINTASTLTVCRQSQTATQTPWIVILFGVVSTLVHLQKYRFSSTICYGLQLGWIDRSRCKYRSIVFNRCRQWAPPSNTRFIRLRPSRLRILNGISFGSVVLPRNAMLARYMLSSECPSVRLSVTSWYCIETTFRRIELVLAWRLPSTYPHCVIRKFGYLQKLEYFPLGLCPKLRT